MIGPIFDLLDHETHKEREFEREEEEEEEKEEAKRFFFFNFLGGINIVYVCVWRSFFYFYGFRFVLWESNKAEGGRRNEKKEKDGDETFCG